MPDHEKQKELSLNAFRQFLRGEIDKVSSSEGQEQIVFKGQWEMEAFSKALDFLKEYTEKNKAIDPFKMTDGVAWLLFAQLLMQMNFKYNAVDALKCYLDLCFDLQKKYDERMHKGATLFWISKAYYNLGQMDVAATYMVYAFVEDILYNGNPFSTAAYREITIHFTTPNDYLRDLTAYANTNYKEFKPFYPEEVIVRYELSKTRTIKKIQGPIS